MGARRLFFAASPLDPNLIGQVLAKLKTLTDTELAGTLSAFGSALARVLGCFSQDEGANYLVNSGQAFEPSLCFSLT